MFSGKTEELLRLIKRAEIAKLKSILIKPATDTRAEGKKVSSHNKVSKSCTVVNGADEIATHAKHYDFIGIDEAQFFNEDLIKIVENLAKDGKNIVLSGLDMDYLGKPFGVVPQLMAIADDVLKLHAICTICGKRAQFSKRLKNAEQTVLVGAEETYTAVCREHFYKN